VKCIRCNRESKKSERSDGKCPGCRWPFAFEPAAGDPYTDPAFQSAIDAVSAQGRIRWLPENLTYELWRRAIVKRRKQLPGCMFACGFVAFGLAVIFAFNFNVWSGAAVIVAALALMYKMYSARPARPEHSETLRHLEKWIAAHGTPETLIVRQEVLPRRRPMEADVGDYSFDRAVITDRSSAVDLLVANNFHFENNCAILSVDGYPPHAFEVVRKMLRRNPRLQVFALHDATPVGCGQAHVLANDPEWFTQGARVVDVGLRPAHTLGWRALWGPAVGALAGMPGLGAADAAWLRRYSLELAALPPEQVLKRLFHAISKPVTEEGGADSDSDWVGVHLDDSFESEAGAGEGGDDGFG